MKEEYNAVYNELNSGVNTITNAVNNVNKGINDCNNIIKGVFDESTFSGPIAESCHGNWSDLSEITMSTNSVLDNSSKVLNQNNIAYQTSDKNESDKVSGV